MSIEKIDFSSVEHDSKPFTTHFNSVLQNLYNSEALGVWAYLSSLPPKWLVNKTQLMGHFRIGRDKLEKILSYLKKNNLVSIERTRLEDGTLAGGFILIKCGVDFKKDCVEEIVQYRSSRCANTPATEKPYVDNAQKNTQKNNTLAMCNLNTDKPASGLSGPGEPTPIKEISKKEINNNKINISCASSDALSGFDAYWEINPKKKNKIRAQKIWKKKNLCKIATLICEDVRNRLENDHQWKNVQFIPHPDTYLTNELWNDDITPRGPALKKGSNTSFSDFINSPTKSGATYDEHGNAINPFN